MSINKLKTVVFAGAGASKAVSSDSFPTTIEFFTRLPPEIARNMIFQQIVGFAKQQLGNDQQIDIEHVLLHLGELKKSLNDLTGNQHISSQFLLGNMLPIALSMPGNFGNLRDVLTRGSSAVTKLEDKINAQVYELYGYEPTGSDLQENWLSLLSILTKENQYIELFTTNYDLVIECAVDELSKTYLGGLRIEDGWRGNQQKYLDVDVWRMSCPHITEPQIS